MAAATTRRKLLAAFAAMRDEEVAGLVATACEDRPTLKAAVLIQLTDEHENRQQKRRKCSERHGHSSSGAVDGGSAAPRVADGQSRVLVDSSPGAHGGAAVRVVLTSITGDTAASISAFENDTVATFKKMYARSKGMHGTGHLQLLLGTTELINEHTLGSYGPFENSTITLTLVRRGNFWPATTWEGRHDGFVFKLGEHGLGYYSDERFAS
eukprot:gnl/TRDRNA2_/TRDRNA2_28960_c0_seq1.p1 gnl/TRDRNA2_/TRDRNA2_28960_c0~~gnl/TRDRNA2_/TRDRNA2_28960_c0_seq1.p1  ORF type:complete len:211 (+),score=23.93 gnl/TRDRNA2_/TRDRNA2_28960_c0_seq1:63-695(+)